MSVIQLLKEIIAERHLLKHKYYQAWSNGQLTIEDLQYYAGQYQHTVDAFPRFISSVHTNCPEIEARKTLLQNLVDEEIHGTDHPTLWKQFAAGLGTSQASMNEKPIIETQAMVDKFYELAKRDWRDGLCALYAYEYQVPEVAASKIVGLKQFYGIQDEKTLEFFTAHQAYDVEHSNQVARLIEKYVEPETAKCATREAVDVLWEFLDGICRVREIHC